MTKRAGRYIDAFGTTTLEPEHAQLWLDGLNALLPTLQLDADASEACTNLIAALTPAVATKSTLLLEGD